MNGFSHYMDRDKKARVVSRERGEGAEGRREEGKREKRREEEEGL